MLVRDLIVHGFKEFEAVGSAKLGHESADRAFQIRVDDEQGKKYYVTAWHYDHRELKATHGLKDMSDEGWVFDAQFHVDAEGGAFVNLGYSPANDDTPTTVLACFERLWTALGKVYYERNSWL